jgi:copper chaperone NosL
MAGAILGTLALAAGACGVNADGPPEIVVDRTACAYCGMLISEPAYAASYRAAGREARAFDDIACLLAAARGEAHGPALQFWFHDAAASGWIDGGDAVFVHSPQLRTPMGGGFVAYRDRAAAARAAEETGGRIVPSIAELLAHGKAGASW